MSDVPSRLSDVAVALRLVETAVPGLRAPLQEAKRGYRARPENVLVPWLVRRWRETPSTRVVDLGAGSGVLGYLAAHALDAPSLTLVEREPVHAVLCYANMGLSDATVSVVEEDLRSWRASEPAQVVLANPPFFRVGEGQPSKNASTRHATHAHFGDVCDFAHAMARSLADPGDGWLLYPADRHADAVEALAGAGLYAREFVYVHAPHRPSLGAYRVWTRATHTPGPLDVTSLSCVAALG